MVTFRERSVKYMRVTAALLCVGSLAIFSKLLFVPLPTGNRPGFYNDAVIAHRISQTITDGGGIQHRVPSRQNACSRAVQIADEVPQRAPGASVSPTVGELVEAVDRHLNRAVADERLSLFFESDGSRCGLSSGS